MDFTPPSVPIVARREPVPLLHTLALRPYQREALAALADARERGIRRQLVVMPTGAGKTIVIAELIRQLLAYPEGHRRRSLILAHRDELISQAEDKVRLVLGPHVDIGIVKAERNDVDADVVIASVQTLSRQERLEQFERLLGLVVVDEAHHSASPSYQRIFQHVGAGEADGPYLVGVTATPNRSDGIELNGTFDEITYDVQMLELMQQGYLVDIRGKQVAIAADFTTLHTRAGDIIDSEAGDLLLAAKAPAQLAQAYRDHASDRKGIVFTPTVAVAYACADALNAVGITAVALDGTTPSHARRRILADLKSGALQVVTNCAVLTEGFDEPSVSCIAMLRPTQSAALFTQMIGRGTRTHPGKTDCLVLDPVGNTTRHDLMSVSSLFGLPAADLSTKTVTEAIAAREAAEIAQAVAGTLVVADVDLFRARPARWVPTSTGRFVLPTGQGTLVLRPTFGDRWDVLHVPHQGPRETLMTNLPLDYATGFAEDHVKALGGQALIDRTARWLQDPPSEKQLRLLHQLGVPFSAIRTKGDASDAIAAAFAARVA